MSVRIAVTLILSFLSFTTSSQTILWHEDFEDLPDEATSDSGTTAWTITADDLRDPNFTNGTHFGIDNGNFLARDLHKGGAGQASSNTTWQSEYVDIVGYSNIFVYIEAFSSLNVTGTVSFEPTDFIEFYYRLDDGPLTQFNNNGRVSDNFLLVIGTSDCSSGLSGDSLQVVIRFSNSSVNEYYYLDNIKIIEDNNRPDPSAFDFVSNISGNWNDPATWGGSTVPAPGDEVLIECNALVELTGTHNAAHVTINSGGGLIYAANNSNLTLNTNGSMWIRDGGLFRIGGTTTPGTYSNTRLNVSGTATITNNSAFNQTGNIVITSAGSSINFNGNGQLETDHITFNANNQTFNNQSHLVLKNNVAGSGSNKTFNNLSDGTLEFRGGVLSGISLNAGTADNTVMYTRTNAQTIIRPVSSNYYNLVIGGSNNKTLSGGTDLNILGDFTIKDDAYFTANQSMNINGNWMNSSSVDGFVEGNHSVSFNGVSQQTITKNAGIESFYDLTVNNANGILLNSEVQVTDQLTFSNGLINSSAMAPLTFSTGSGYTGANETRYINGPVQKTGTTAFTFPTGNGEVYAPVEITAPSSSSTFMAAYYFNQFADLTADGLSVNNVSEVEYWEVNRTSGSADVAIVLHYLDATRSKINDFSSSDLLAAHYSGTEWVAGGSSMVASSTSGTVTTFDPSGFGYFTFGSTNGNNTLPIVLGKWSAESISGQVKLEWATFTEINNDYFTIERSKNGTEWEVLNYVSGAGNSNEIRNYELFDRKPLPGNNYYRLTQTDFDGGFEVFDVISVNIASDADMNIWPNPSNGQSLNITSSSPVETLQILIYDMNGAPVYGKTVNGIDRNYNLNGLTLETGIYIVKLINDGNSRSVKLNVR